MIVDRVALDRRRTRLPGELRGAGQERVGDALTAAPGPYPDAPHRPQVQVVDVRDLAAGRKRCVGTGMDRCPADDFAAVVGEYAGRALAHQFSNLVGTVGAAQCEVLLGGDSIAQAPAHVGVRAFGPDHRLDVDEVRRRSHLDPHGHHPDTGFPTVATALRRPPPRPMPPPGLHCRASCLDGGPSADRTEGNRGREVEPHGFFTYRPPVLAYTRKLIDVTPSTHRQGHRRLQASAPPPRVPGIPQAGRPRLPPGRVAPGDGQLRRSQEGRGP